MDAGNFDIVVIGAGMAGATTAAHLATDYRVALIEAEDAAGYHTTGRSASMWILGYGPPDVRVLTSLSRGFYESPPAGFSDQTLTRARQVLTLAGPGEETALRATVAGIPGARAATVAEARALVPALRPDYAAAAAIEDGFDLDVAAIHQGFLRMLRSRGGALALRHRAGRIERRGGRWHVETSDGATFAAPVVVNAAGAWGDGVAARAGVAPLGLVAKRRTGAIIDPAPYAVADWPMVMDFASTWYARPEARTRLMVSPADETPMPPQDVQPDELDVAIGIDRMQQALAIEVRRVERSWAGLRTFTPDGSLGFGWAPGHDGFFWCVGQGGYGIQTAPAAGRFVADLVAGRDPGAAAAIMGIVDPARFMA